MTTKDGLDFEAIAKKIAYNRCESSDDSIQLIEDITEALKEAADAAYERGAKVVLPYRKSNTGGLTGREPTLPWHWHNEGFNECIDEIKKLNPHLFWERK